MAKKSAIDDVIVRLHFLMQRVESLLRLEMARESTRRQLEPEMLLLSLQMLQNAQAVLCVAEVKKRICVQEGNDETEIF